MVKNAIILSAGYGKRLRPISFFIPKPLIKINGKRIIFNIIENLERYGVEKFYINLYYKKEKIEKFLKKSKFREKIFIYKEKELMGTGGGVKNFEKYIDDDFFIHNVDIYHNLNLKEFIEFHKSHKKIGSVLIFESYSKSEFIIKDNYVVDILKRKNKEKVLTYSGIGIFRKEFFNYIKDGKSDLIDAFYKIISLKELMAYKIKNKKIFDIGTYKGLFETMI
ncbi:MAG: nucleotidyltransferase family protein [candidate division WOR-3 bacterium]